MTVDTATFVLAQGEFTRRVHAIGPEQWSLPTPDAEWTVAELVGHLVTEHRWAEPMLRELALPDCATAVEKRYQPIDRDTLVDDWDVAAAVAASAFQAPHALEGRVELNRGWAPAREYFEEMIFDLVVHAWDLGRAIGYPDALPDGLVTAMSDLSDAVIDRTPAGMFAAAVDVRDGAPLLDRLIARTGRDPATPTNSPRAER